LLRSDGKRPDGLTLVPWQSEKPLTWDVTVAHTLAASYVSSTASEAGATAEMAVTQKSSKYADLSHSHHFQPFAFEALGSMNSSAVPSSRIWAAESARSWGTHGKRPISSSILQSPHNASTPFCFDTLSLPMSPRTIQMPSHSSFLF